MIREGEGEAPKPDLSQLDDKLADLERRLLQECMAMILEALEKQGER